MEQSNIKLEFKEKFSKYSGSRFEICYDIYTGLMSNKEEDRIELLSYACNHFGITDSDGSFSPCGSGISQNEVSDLRDEYGQTVDTLLDALLQKAIRVNMPTDLFYKDVWNLIIQNPIFGTEHEKAFALYYILIDTRIPYYPIRPGMEMNNSEFKTIIRECEEAIQKAKFVLAVDFPQKTMEASNLVDIILSQDDYKKQVVVMSKIVLELRDRNKRLLNDILDKIKEDS